MIYLSLNKFPIGNNKGYVFTDATLQFDDEGLLSGWGGAVLDFDNFTYDGDRIQYDVLFEGTFKTPTETKEFSFSLPDNYIFGTTAVPIVSQSEITFCLVMDSTGELSIIKTEDYDASNYVEFPDGILDYTYKVLNGGSYDDSEAFTERLAILDKVNSIINSKVINLDLKFFSDNYDINSLLDLLIMDGLNIAITKSAENASNDTATLKMIEAITNTANEYYVD